MEKEIYLAGGCFWGTEHFFRHSSFILETEVGYANGSITDPTYEQVCSGTTGFVEAVRLTYDSAIISLPQILDLFFLTIDPTSVNRQGNDIGEQYRTGIYYTDPADAPVIAAALTRLEQMVGAPIAVEQKPLQNFYRAETMHQNYLNKNVFGYCHIDRSLFSLAKEYTPKETVDRDEKGNYLPFLTYKVTQFGCTEKPYENAYWDCFDDGIYVDAVTGTPVFTSKEKFFSDSGWPAFTAPITPEAVVERPVECSCCQKVRLFNRAQNAYLGVVFNDDASDGAHYCINSAALRFVPKEALEEEGLGEFRSLWA